MILPPDLSPITTAIGYCAITFGVMLLLGVVATVRATTEN